MVPAMRAADAARAVIGPDDPAATRIAVIGIVAAIVAPVEMAMAVIGGAIAAIAVIAAVMVNSAVAIAAAMKGGRGAEATTVETTAADATEMSSAAVEAAPAMEAAAMTTTAMPTATARGEHHVVACGLRRRQRRRIDWSHRLGRTRGPGRQHQRRGGRNPEQAHRACPETEYSQHGLLPESGLRSCDARSRRASALFIDGRSQD